MRSVIALLIACVCTAGASAQVSSIVEVRGFRIEFGLVSEKKRDSLLASLKTQVEIVERAQVPPEVMEFFRSIPIIIDPKLEGTKGHANRVEGQQIVTLQDEKLPPDRPILLHELLHGYFSVKLRGSTPIIPKTYREAKNSKYYPRQYYDAHFMENPNEYFTVISSIFLFGRIDQPPYDCAQVSKHHPEFIAFLETQFGPHKCK